ncbi:MAG: hypothetical protein FJW31_26130 [Acidobacteria bacterium]|nr:hypothetical protein [Acidobacteriota bacterium]
MRAGVNTGPLDFSLTDPAAYLQIARNHMLGCGPLAAAFVWCGLGFVLGRVGGERQRPATLPSGTWTLLACLVAPAALDNILLLNHTANHRYAVLKWAPAIGLMLAMLSAARPWRNLRLDAACAILTAGLCATVLWWTKFDREPASPEIARIVQYQVGLDRVLFLQRNRSMQMADPSLLLLSERNFHMVNSRAEAMEKLRRLNGIKGNYIVVKS